MPLQACLVGCVTLLLLLLSRVRSYTMPGKRNTLLLHCSLQRATGRMLVHTVEVNNSANDHVSILLVSSRRKLSGS